MGFRNGGQTVTTLTGTPHSERSGWRADIQGLRAVAVLAVIIFHAGIPLPGGFTGVDVFFVISGYVITEMLLREWHTTGRIRLGSFYLRRFKRLVPALAIVVSVTLLASIVLLPPLGEENRVLYTAAGAMAFGANVVIAVLAGDYFAASAQSNPLLHTWSLSVEEQFYFIFPAVLLAGLVVLGRRIGAFRGAFIAVGAIAAISFGLAVAGARIDMPVGDAVFGFYSPVTRAWEFAVGALIALASPSLRQIPQWLARLSSLVGVAAIALSFLVITEQTPFPGVWALLPVGGTALLIISSMGLATPAATRVISTRPMVRIGDWSYSLYLWHWPFVVFASVIWRGNDSALMVAAALSVIPALLSFYLVEQPLRFKQLGDVRRVKKLLLGVFVPPGLVIAGTWLFSFLFLSPLLQDQLGNPLEESPAVDQQCLTERGFDADWVRECTWNAEATGDPIYLIGDSNAAHFDVAVIGAGENLGRPVTIVTSDSCEPIQNFQVVDESGRDIFTHCPGYRAFIYDFLASAAPGDVVISFLDISTSQDNEFYSFEQSPPVTGVAQKQKILTEALGHSVDKLLDAGHRVTLVQGVPTFRLGGPGYEPQACTLSDLVSDACATPFPRETVDAVQEPNRLAIAAVARQSGARVLDFVDRYCDEAFCSPSQDGRLLYLDDIHISVTAARELIPEFTKALR